MATTTRSLPGLLFLILIVSTPQPSHSLSYFQIKTVFSLSHSLMTRVANLRASRGDYSGSLRARLMAEKLERGLGLGLWGSMWSLGWDYVRNYAWRDLASLDVYDAVSDMNELLRDLCVFTRIDSDAERAAWVSRNYRNILRVSNSLLRRLLKVVHKSAWRDMVESLQVEVMDGGLLKDCLELGSSDLKGLVQIFKDLALQFGSTNHDHESEL